MKTLRIPLVIVLLVVTGRVFNAEAQTETNLFSFVGSPNNGETPEARLVQGSDGNFYGTTFAGGSGNGTIFVIGPSGTYTSLYSFGGVANDGGLPQAGLVQGSNGNFYGTTYLGGTSTNCGGGCGTVFRITPSGTYTSLYSFVSYPADGASPEAGLVQGSDGNFYGTTYGGGTNNPAKGTVFRISPSGTYTSLYSFVGSPGDGANPHCVLVQGSDSNLYGTTEFGGANNLGTVFRISPSGTHTSLYSFGNIPYDGNYPVGGLAQGSDGKFYGTTYEGGPNGNGTIFRISTSGTYTSLYTFLGFPGDGIFPEAGLVQGSDGDFYGTTYYGGTSNNCFGGCGIVFRISPSGTYTSLYAFVGSPGDGANPVAGLVQGSDGKFYGTTSQGGAYSYGNVFWFSVPLNPPANQISRIQKSGTNVVLAIPSVAGETYQLQFSSSLTPTNWVNEGRTMTSIGALLTLTNFGGAVGPQGFYRFDITP